MVKGAAAKAVAPAAEAVATKEEAGGGGGSERGASNQNLTGPLARHRHDLAGSLARPAVSGHTCTTCWCGLCAR